MPTTTPRIFKTVDPSRPPIRGGFFSITDVARRHPLNWRYGRMVMEEYLRPGKDYEKALQAIGERIKNEWISYLQMGRHHGPPPLSFWTLKARRMRDVDGQGFMYDTGELAGALKVILKKRQYGRSGAAGVAIELAKGLSSHSLHSSSVIDNWKLITIICQTGLVVSADELSPEALRKIMAWRDLNFERETSIGEGSPAENWETMKNLAKAEEDESFLLMYYTKTRERRERSVRRQALGGKARKPILFIPPRPLFTDPLRKKLEKAGRAVAREYFTRVAALTAHVLGTEPWTAGTWTRYRARKALIEPEKRSAPWIPVKE